MTDYVESGVRLIGDTQDASDKMQDLISLADDIDNLSPTLTVESDTSALNDLEDEFGNLEDTTVTTTIDPEVTEEGKSLLTTLHELGVNPMQIIMNIGGTILDLAGKLNEFAVQPLLDIDTAVARINAQTGNAIPNARELLNSLYPADIGDVDAIANALIHAQQLGLPLEEATKAALEFVKVFPENNPNDVMDALDQMVKNKLAPDITTAADLLTTAQQNGINKGNDLISVFDRSSTAIKNLGLTGDEFLALASADLAGGGASAQTFLDTLTKIKANLQSGNKNATDALAILGIEDPATTGQGYTDDFFKSVADAIANYKGTDAEKQALFQALVGSKLGQKDYEGYLNIAAAEPSLNALKDATARAATDMDNSLSGAIDDFMLAAQTAAMEFLSSEQIDLPGKIEALKTGLQDALSVLQEGGTLGDALTVGLKPIGWDDEFQKLEAVFGNFIVSLLGVIATIQEVLNQPEQAAATRSEQARLAQQQLAFNLQVANADEIATDIQNAVANGVTPEGITDAIGTSVSELVSKGALEQAQALVDQFSSQKQLTVTSKDILGNEADKITIPITPEMTDADIQAASEAAQKKLLDRGGLGWTTSVEINDVTVDPEAVQTMQDEINAAALKTKALGGQQTPTSTVNATSTTSAPGLISPEALALQSTEAEKATAKLNDFSSGVTASKDATELASTATADLTAKTTSAVTATYDHGRVTQIATNAVEVSTEAMDLQALASSDLGKDLYGAFLQMQNLSDTTHDFVTNAALAVQTMRDAAAAASGAGGSDDTTPHPGKKASGGAFRGLSWVGEDGPELIGSGQTMSVLNNRTSRALMQALSGMPFMHYGGAGGGKNVSVTVNNNVQNLAQANAISYDIGQQVRGF